jgi:hypothetical protein
VLRTQFGMYLADPTRLRLADGFVVKYDAEKGQKELKPHRDGSVLSFNIALNPANEFEGGGTWFDSIGDAIKIDEGQIVSHVLLYFMVDMESCLVKGTSLSAL